LQKNILLNRRGGAPKKVVPAGNETSSVDPIVKMTLEKSLKDIGIKKRSKYVKTRLPHDFPLTYSKVGIDLGDYMFTETMTKILYMASPRVEEATGKRIVDADLLCAITRRNIGGKRK